MANRADSVERHGDLGRSPLGRDALRARQGTIWEAVRYVDEAVAPYNFHAPLGQAALQSAEYVGQGPAVVAPAVQPQLERELEPGQLERITAASALVDMAFTELEPPEDMPHAA